MATRPRIKAIIMDKAPNGDGLQLGNQLGFSSGNSQTLADAINLEFSTSFTSTDIDNQPTVNDVVVMVENVVGP